MSLFLCHINVTMASGIRTIYMDGLKMEPIHIKLGRAVVIRFFDKPYKAVIGNQNYYAIDFVENDVIIQATGEVNTNLFVYTRFDTYGFILKACYHCLYDDLLHVKRKMRTITKLNGKKKGKKVKRENLSKPLDSLSLKSSLNVGLGFHVGSLFFRVKKITKVTRRSLKVIDLQIKNEGGSFMNMDSIQIKAIRGKSPLPLQKHVIAKDGLESRETTRARLFIPLKENKGFTIKASNNGKIGQVIIDRKYLK